MVQKMLWFKPGRRLATRRLLSIIACAAPVCFAVAAILAGQLTVLRMRQSFEWVKHTQHVLLEVADLNDDLASARAAQRGYLLTKDPQRLAEFQQMRSELDKDVDELADLITDNAAQRLRLDDLRSLVQRWMERLAWQATRAATLQEVLESLRADDVERRERSEIAAAMRRFREVEIALLDERQQHADLVTTTSTYLGVITILLALASAALVGFLVQHERGRAREQAMQSELLHMSRITAMSERTLMLAHEVNQPLTAAGNFLAAARRLLNAETIVRERLADIIDRTASQVVRAGDIVVQLRRFTGRPSTDDRSAEPIGRVIEEAILVSALEFGEARIQRLIGADLPLAVVNRVQVQQVLVNLLRNAVDAMANLERRELIVGARLVHGQMIEVSVEDSGPGVPDDVAKRLFQPFVTTKQGGMGVGLSICHRIVESHGGRIWAEPVPSGGTRFCFTVPVAKASAQAA
jgi:C4-dicarboxylate-specific signal transduction histidine kinase